MLIKKLSPHFGLEIHGIKLCTFDKMLFNKLKELLVEHQLLLIRNQSLTYEQYIKCASMLGQVTFYPFSLGLENHPEIVQIRKEPSQKNNFSGLWHVDSSYLDEPPDFTLLHAENTPPIGGDTVFSNTAQAFEALSPSLRETLETLKCLYVSDLYNQDRTKHIANISQSKPLSAIHPAIITHPTNLKKAIYVNEEHTHSFIGMTRTESVGLISFLTSFIKRSEFTLRVSWEKGSLAIWDNRTTQHHAVNDYHGYLRVMNRITVLDNGLNRTGFPGD
ncbi:TPA: TauD/TfdA family dioxygenase [Klebsiella michiganensis]|nr:TauD/TfdA family dioxygenase [Klebsiella michiganensis]